MSITDFFISEAKNRETTASASPILKEKIAPTVRNPQMAPTTIGEVFSAGFDVGVDQLEGDLNRVKAIGNLFIGNEEAAKRNLQRAEFDDQEAGRVLEGFRDFESFLEEPTLEGFTQQVFKSIGQFAPLAITSVASGFTGAAAGIVGRGALTSASRAATRELFTGALKKKSLQQTLTPEENIILNGAYNVGKFAKGGALVGAFSQEQLIGSSQALAEFQDSGREITVDEAASATLLGVPQAVLGTLSEAVFATSLFRLAYRKSPLGMAQQKQKLGKKLDSQEQKLLDIADKRARGQFLTKAEDDLYRAAINPGSYFGNLMKDVANATAASATAEGITELGQEEILIQQRKSIDPNYSNEEANLRRAESAFAGFFAGGARAAVSAPVSSIFNTARKQLQENRDNREYAKLREEQYGPVSGMPIPETKKQLEAQIQQFKEGKKDAIYVSEGMEFSKDMLKEAGITDADSITVPGIGTFITNNPDKFSKLLIAQAENNLLNNAFLADFLGYSNVGTATDDLVVIVIDPSTGEVIEQQTTDTEGQELAIRNFRERYGEDVIIETEILDDAVKNKKSKNAIEDVSEETAPRPEQQPTEEAAPSPDQQPAKFEIPPNVKVGDQIDVFDATGKPYKTTVTAVSPESGNVKVIDESGKEVIMGMGPSAMLENVNSPEYTLQYLINRGDAVGQMSPALLDELEARLKEKQIEIRNDPTTMNKEGLLQLIQRDLNAITYQKRRNAKTSGINVRQEGGTIDEDLDDVERAQFTAEGRIDEFGQELGIEEAFDLSTAEGGTSYILVGPEKGKQKGQKNRYGKVIGDPDTFNLIDPETEANYGPEQRAKLREKRNKVIADIEGKDFEGTRTVFGQELPTGSTIDEGAELRPDLAFINQLGDGPLDKYLKFIERNPNVDIQFELGADNKVRLRIQAQPGVGSGVVATEEEAVKKAVRAARVSAFIDDNKTTGFSSDTKDFKWFLDIPNAKNEDKTNNNTNQKPINMNKLLQEAVKIWSADVDAGTKDNFTYRQQLALGFGQIYDTLSKLTDNEGNNITLNYLDKNTGEVFNLTGMASSDRNALSRVPIYFDFVDKKYLSLTELSKQTSDPDKTIRESILTLAGRILAVTSFQEGVQGRPTFDDPKLKAQGIGTKAKTLIDVNPVETPLYRVKNLKTDVTVTLGTEEGAKKVTIKNGDIIDDPLRIALRETNYVAGQEDPVLTERLSSEEGLNTQVRVKQGFTRFEYSYSDILRAMIGPEAAKEFIGKFSPNEGYTLKKAEFETYLENFLGRETPQAAVMEGFAIEPEEAFFNLEDFATEIGVYTDNPRDTAEALNNMPGVGGSNEFAIGQIQGFLRQGLPLNRTTFELTDNEIAFQRKVTDMELRRPGRAEAPLDKVEKQKLANQETRRVDVEGGVRVSNVIAQMFDEEAEGNFEDRVREGEFIKEPTLIRGLKAVIKNLGLNRDTVVIASNETDLTIGLEGTYTTPNATDGKSPNQISGIGGINAFIRRQQEEVENDTNPNNFARIIQFGDKDVIILKSYQADELSGGNPTAQAVERRVIALGHEFGHSFLFQEIERIKDTPIFKKLEAAFNKIIEAGDAPAAYLGKYGFEEFFADQFGLASVQRLNNLKATDAVSSFFHRVVKRMETFFKSLTGALEKRYGRGVTTEFNDFMQQVRTKYLDNATNPNNGPGTKAEIQVRNAIFEVTEKAGKWLGGKKTINKLNKAVDQAMSTLDNTSIAEKAWWGLKYIFLPAHNYLVQQQKRTSDATSKKVIQDLADQTYIASKKQGRGYVNSHPNERAEKINELLSLPELGIEDPLRPTATEMERLETIFLEVEKNPRDREAGELATAVTAVENFLNKFWNDVLRENNIPFRENYFPRALDLAALMADPNKQKALADLLAKANPEQAAEPTFDFNKVVAQLITGESDATLDNFEVGTDEAISDIAVGSNRERSQYFKNLSNAELREIGVLLPSVTSMFEYIDASVKRVEFNKNYKYKLSDISPEAKAVLLEREIGFSEKATLEGTPNGTLVGWKAIEAQLAEIKDPKIRREARNVLKSMLGKSDTTMSPFARSLNSFFLTLNVVTYLTFAPLASFPDLAGPILFSGDYRALTQDLPKVLGDLSTKEGRKRLEKLSLDIGVNSASALHQFYINAAEQNYVGPTARKIQDVFFKYTGLEAFTRLTRYYAAGMAQSFLIRAAEGAREGDSILAEQLRSLGVTPDQVEAWQKDGGDFNLHPEIKKAHAQFVDESIVRPNSAERPAWASSPYFALIWQLKSFFYAYGKNIMMGLYRTARLRGKEAGLTAMSAPLILGAVTLLPLTMIGLELRELIKYLAGGGDASKLRTNDMDWPEYSFEILDRSGALGPFGLMIPAIEAEKYGDEFWISPLGPTAERFEDLIQGDFKLKDLTPVLSSL